MKLTEDEKMMIVSAHAQAIVNMASCGYACAPVDVVERLKRMMDVLADQPAPTAS
jgi:hypothetical protein